MTLPLTLTLPAHSARLPRYGRVVITASEGTLVPSVYQFSILYAEKAGAASREAHISNCVQRAHHNTLEYLPLFVFTTLISGPKHRTSLQSCSLAYTTGGPQRRVVGAVLGCSLQYSPVPPFSSCKTRADSGKNQELVEDNANVGSVDKRTTLM
ncbi:hypothetical protein V8E36_004302 [Tilletia maclaganii]